MPADSPMRMTLAALCCLLACSVPAAFAQSTPAVVHAVLLSDAAHPLANAEVLFETEGLSYRFRTDAHGAFVAVVEPGRYTISIDTSGHSGASPGPTWTNVVLEAGREVRLLATLDRASSAAEGTAGPRRAPTDSTSGAALTGLLLEHLPLARPDALATTPEVFPGVADGSILGAGAQTSTRRRIDGIDLSDPLDGRVWTSFIATTAEQFTLRMAGLPAAAGGFTGGVIDVVTRAGGNTLSGLFDARMTSEGWATENVTDALLERNPRLADRTRLDSSADASAWIGGPIRPNRAFFAAAFGYGRHRSDPDGPRSTSRTSSARAQGRLAFARRPSDSLTSSIFFEDRSATGLAAEGLAPVITDDVADRQDGRTTAASVAWQRAVSPRLQVRASYTVLDGSRETQPGALVPGRVDGVTGAYSGSQGRLQRSGRQRHLASGSVVLPAHAAGSHVLEAGGEFESSRVDEATRFVDDTFFVDFSGRPNTQIDWMGSDRQGRSQRLSAYVQDGWSPLERLTVNLGLRLDRLSGATPALGRVYEAVSVQPRAGLTIDVTGGGTMLARAHYGQYAEPLWFSHYDRATPGVAPMISYELLPGGARREVEQVTTPVYSVDPALRHPRVDEISAGLERRLGRRASLGVTGVVRDVRHVIDAVFPEARWIPVVRGGLAGGTLTVYRWANRLASEGSAIIQNVDGVTYLGPSGTTIGTASATRRSRVLLIDGRYDAADGRWALWSGWTLGRTEGTVDNTFVSSIGRSGRFASPSASLINSDGSATHTPAHKIAVLATARVPWIHARVSGTYIGRSGRRYAAVRQFGNETIDFPQSADGRQVLLEARGTRALPFDQAVDLRTEYALGLGARRALTFYLDVINVLDRATVLDVATLYPVSSEGTDIVRFEAPTRIREPRRLYVGGRWAF